MKRLPDYIKDMSYAIGVMRDEGKPVDFLVRHINSLKAIYPNLDTRIDLHEVYLEESRKPIKYLYLTQKEIFMIQTHGRVPEKNTKIYKTLEEAYYRQS